MTEPGTAIPEEARPASVLQLLHELGVAEDEAWRMVEPITDWFDGMSVGLAEAMCPRLGAALAAKDVS